VLTRSSDTSESLLPWSLQVIVLSIFHYATWLDLGAAYGTARSGIGIGAISILKPELIMRSIVPVVMAGILGIYGMIVSVILCQKSTNPG